MARYDTMARGINKLLLAAAGIHERDRVLDIGCGIGFFTRLAARRAGAGRVLGVDLSAPMLAREGVVTAEDGVPNMSFGQGGAGSGWSPPPSLGASAVR